MDTKVVIKLVPSDSEVPLKYVNSIEYATPKTARNGKIVTGIDEFALSISELPEGEQKAESNKIKKLRESLEKLLGEDLTPSSSFWNDFVISLEDSLILDSTNPRDVLNEKFLVANGYVAPSLEEARNEERFMNCIFYIHREKEEIALKAKKQKLADRATAKLINLYEENPNHLKLVYSYLFGFDISSNIDEDEAYLKLKEHLNPKDKEGNQKRNIEDFLAAASKTSEEIMVKKIFDKAIKKKLISKKGDSYKRGDEEYGDSYEDALEFLQLPENSGELAYLRKKVEI